MAIRREIRSIKELPDHQYMGHNFINAKSAGECSSYINPFNCTICGIKIYVMGDNSDVYMIRTGDVYIIRTGDGNMISCNEYIIKNIIE